MLYTLLLFLSFALSAGESATVTAGNYCDYTAPTRTTTDDWRVEFQLHDFVAGSDTLIFFDNGLGLDIEYLSTGQLRVTDKRDTTSGTVAISLTGRTNVLVRIQRKYTDAIFSLEVWDYDGSDYVLSSSNITAFNSWAFSGGRVGFASGTATAKVGFFRIWSTVVAAGTRPPTTAPSGTTHTHLKFDGNTNDASGNGRNCSTVTGTLSYSTTPNQGVFAIPKANATSFTNSFPCRAGHSCTFDGSSSFSLGDSGDTVTYFWQQVTGATTLEWSSRTSATPAVTRGVFGPYTISLTATDAGGASGYQTLDVGFVAYTGNGVVINADANADLIFGPMIALGQNPWPWADDQAYTAAASRSTGGANAYVSPPVWETNLAGTVSYTPAGTSIPSKSTLSAGITATDLSISVTDASTMDWTSLPTIVLLGPVGAHEEVLICNRVGNTLTVCFDGRGRRGGSYERVVASSWSSGADIRQIKTIGTGTAFLTDFCSAGVGEPGGVYYSTGTVSVTAGSTTLTGSGTTWTSAMESRRIRIVGTHSGGTPFTFFASISGPPGSTTSLTMATPWPSGADTASGLSYAILESQAVYISRDYTRTDGSGTGKENTGVSWCASDTVMYTSDSLLASSGAGAQSGKNYQIGGSWTSEFSYNYYDEVLAHYAGYYRSGLRLFRDNARAIGDYWVSQPSIDDGWVGQLPRRYAATGIAAAAVLDGRSDNWYFLRKLATSAVDNPYTGAITPNCGADLRETAYSLSWIALAAMFDPVDTGSSTTPNQRSYWKAKLAEALTRDQTCKTTSTPSALPSGYSGDNSFPAPYFAGSGSYSMVNGSATVTGSGFSSALCNVVVTGSITVTNGSTVATGTNFVTGSGRKIVVKVGGSVPLFYSLYTYNSSTSITLATPFDGASGTYDYQIEGDTYWLTFAADSTDYVNINRFHSCTYVSSTELTLDRPWAGITGTYAASRYLELGYGTQPFLAGIKVLAMKLASLGASGSTATGYGTIAAATAAWIKDVGFDSVTGGLHYARGYRGCEPVANPRMNCTYATDTSAKIAARFLNGEAQNAIRVAYEADPTNANKTIGDQFYAAQWAKNSSDPSYDGVYLSTLGDGVGIWAYKYLGFFFGVGMAHQWPAVRVGGIPAQSLDTYQFHFTLPTGANKVALSVIRPSGETVTPATCTTSPCSFTYDSRQGTHLVRWTYQTSGGATVSQSDYTPIQ